MTETVKKQWYAGGLHFECVGCGNCCAGPEEGYIWISGDEIERLAKHLGITVEAVRKKYLHRVGMRHSILENPATKDCIFLTAAKDGQRGCAIYSVRPNQCRTWPFWNDNLSSAQMWDFAAVKCPGINCGRGYTFDEIETLRKQKQWWKK
jgi:Fe-S-cluster containining protein